MIKICEIIKNCEECPRYADDCDGKGKEDEQLNTKGGWIPIDVALPVMDCDVFVSVHVRDYWYDGECIEYDITKYGRFNADFLEFQHRNHCPINCKNKRVTAWQPIPEPYKEKAND